MKPKINITESFGWVDPNFRLSKGYGKNTIKIRGKALCAGTISRNKRKYLEEELNKSARTFENRKITINHSPWDASNALYDPKKVVGHIQDAEFEDDCIEYTGFITKQPYVDMLRNKSTEIRGVSVEADYLYNKCVKCGKRFYSEQEFRNHMEEEHFIKDPVKEVHGIHFRALSLVLAPEEPGVEDTSLEIWETKIKNHGALQLLETVITTRKEEENYMKNRSRKAVVTPEKRMAVLTRKNRRVKEQEDPCPEGEHRNEEGDCVPDEPATEQEDHGCAEGEHWSKEEGKCVPNVTEQEDHGCSEDEHWDAEKQECVANKAEEQEDVVKDSKGCIVGEEVWSELEGKCVKLSAEEKKTLAPALKMLKKQYVEVRKLKEQEEPCPTGQHRDEAGNCVPDEPLAVEPPVAEQEMPVPTPEPEKPLCPVGWHNDEATGLCVEDEVADAELTNVVVAEQEMGTVDTPPPYPIEEPIPDCGLNAHYDPELKVCVPDIVPKEEQVPPDQPEAVPSVPADVAEIRLPQLLKLGEPFADYTDMADCEAKNQDKEDPAAFCISIKRKVEGEPASEIKETTNVYESLRTLTSTIQQTDFIGYKRDVLIAESLNSLNKTTAILVKFLRETSKQLEAVQNQTVTESRLRARYDVAAHKKVMEQLAKAGKAVSVLHAHNQKVRSGLATEVGKNTAGREHNRKVVSGLVAGINKNIESRQHDRKNLSHVTTEARRNTTQISQLKKDGANQINEVKALLCQHKKDVAANIKEIQERSDKTEKTWKEVDEAYLNFKEEKEKEIAELKTENVAIKDEFAKFKEQSEKKLQETAVRMDNVEGKQKGDFKGVKKPVKETPKEHAEDPLKTDIPKRKR